LTPFSTSNGRSKRRRRAKFLRDMPSSGGSIPCKEVGGVTIEIELRHKQRAVGFQPMLFLLIPLEQLRPCEGPPSLVGRPAEKNEVACWEPRVCILFEVVKGFSLASRSHRGDMLCMLEMVLEGVDDGAEA